MQLTYWKGKEYIHQGHRPSHKDRRQCLQFQPTVKQLAVCCMVIDFAYFQRTQMALQASWQIFSFSPVRVPQVRLARWPSSKEEAAMARATRRGATKSLNCILKVGWDWRGSWSLQVMKIVWMRGELRWMISSAEGEVNGPIYTFLSAYCAPNLCYRDFSPWYFGEDSLALWS